MFKYSITQCRKLASDRFISLWIRGEIRTKVCVAKAMLNESKIIQGYGLVPALLKRTSTVGLDWDVRDWPER
jgi:hypothetical protein